MKYKVIEIIDDQNILVDYGSENGAKEGMLLNIIVPGEPVIIDNKDYGTFDLIKETITIETAYPKFSLCQKQLIRTYDLFSPLSRLKKTSIQAIKMNVDDSQKTNRQQPINSPIAIGDIVVPKNS